MPLSTSVEASFPIYLCKDKHAWRCDEGIVCPVCKKGWRRRTIYKPVINPDSRHTPSFNAFVFKPYTEDGINGEPIRLESRSQRDRLCRENHLTYDITTNVRKPDVGYAIDTIDYGDVKEALEHGTPNDDELDLPAFEPEGQEAAGVD